MYCALTENASRGHGRIPTLVGAAVAAARLVLLVRAVDREDEAESRRAAADRAAALPPAAQRRRPRCDHRLRWTRRAARPLRRRGRAARRSCCPTPVAPAPSLPRARRPRAERRAVARRGRRSTRSTRRSRSADRSGALVAAHPRHGRPRDHAQLRTAAAPPADRALDHAVLRVQRGRRRPDRQRPLARRAAAPTCCARRSVARLRSAADDLRRRDDDRRTDQGRDGRTRRADRGRHERRAAAGGARLPGPDRRARPVRLRVGLQVGHRHRGDHVRRPAGVLGAGRLGAADRDQAAVAHRHAALGRAGAGRPAGRDRRRRVGPARRRVGGRGAGRRRAMVAGAPGRRAVDRHLAAVGRGVDAAQAGQLHAAGARDRRGRHAAGRRARRRVPVRRDRPAHDHRARRVARYGGRGDVPPAVQAAVGGPRRDASRDRPSRRSTRPAGAARCIVMAVLRGAALGYPDRERADDYRLEPRSA